MALKNPTPGAKRDPGETVHLQVKAGKVALYKDKAYGDRGTLQVPRRDADALLKAGDVYEVQPDEVPEVSALPDAA